MLKFVYNKGMMKMKIGEYNVEVRRSKRKSAAIKITAECKLLYLYLCMSATMKLKEW